MQHQSWEQLIPTPSEAIESILSQDRSGNQGWNDLFILRMHRQPSWLPHTVLRTPACIQAHPVGFHRLRSSPARTSCKVSLGRREDGDGGKGGYPLCTGGNLRTRPFLHRVSSQLTKSPFQSSEAMAEQVRLLPSQN